jgi:hypothetical protein
MNGATPVQTDRQPETPAAPAAGAVERPAGTETEDVDLEALAERILELLRRDLLIERERERGL